MLHLISTSSLFILLGVCVEHVQFKNMQSKEKAST